LSPLRVLCLGDVVGRPGRRVVAELVPALRRRWGLDLVIVNAENAAGGLGIDPATALELRAAGVDILTSGDHVWQKKVIRDFLDENTSWCIRPANYADGAPGRGWTIWESPAGVKVGIINLMGRVFMNLPLDCPFKAARSLLDTHLSGCKVIICDLHAEATSEKGALVRYLGRRASLVFGTHTHVQTADEAILSEHTAFISDLGMCGSLNGVIGMDAEAAMQRLISGLPVAYKVAEGEIAIQGVLCEIDPESGRALKIERVREKA
jgi:2',3'-cyclic-nucleotide 2'-phosphodiesterase